MKILVERIEIKLESQESISLETAKNNILPNASGFYWIYTKLPMNKFAKAASPSNSAHIDFSRLAEIHIGVKSIITQTDTEYWCIYNGKAKQLRNRIAAQFTNTKGETGKLALLRCFQKADFRIKYIACETDSIQRGIPERYDDIKRDLERVWRLSYGWPFLCRT